MKTRRLVVGFVTTLWVLIVISAYYVIHRPWPVEVSSSPLLALLDLLFALGLTSLAGGIGERLVGGINTGGPLEQAAVQIAMGVGIIGVGMFGLGMIGALHEWIILILFAVGIIILRGSIGRWYAHLSEVKKQFHLAGTAGKIFALSVAVMLLMSLCLALAPPLKWDSLVYHLELPKEYLRLGRIHYLSDNQFVGLPQLVEMNFTAAMALRSGETAAVYGWMVGVIALLGVGGYASRILGSKVTFLAPMVLLTGESFAEGLSWAYTDIWVFLFSLSMFIALDCFTKTKDRRLLLIAAIQAGFALSVKYVGGLALLCGIALLLLETFREYRTFQTDNLGSNAKERISRSIYRTRDILGVNVQNISIFLIVAILIFSPWLLKNLAFTGNPVYPYFFEGGAIDKLRQSFYVGPPPQRTLIDDLILPWEASIRGVEYSPGYSTSIGPLLLALIPCVFLTMGLQRGQPRENLNHFYLIAIIGWLVWAVGSHFSEFLISSRLYYSIFPALAILASAGYEYLKDLQIPKVRVHILIQALVLLAVALSITSSVFRVVERDPFPVIFGLQPQNEYLFHMLGFHINAMEAINRLPQDSKVALLWESRSYYCQVRCSPDVVIDRWWALSRSLGDVNMIARGWQESGITHVLVYNAGVDFLKGGDNLFEERDWTLLDRFIAERLTRIEDFGDVYTLYSLNAE